MQMPYAAPGMEGFDRFAKTYTRTMRAKASGTVWVLLSMSLLGVCLSLCVALIVSALTHHAFGAVHLISGIAVLCGIWRLSDFFGLYGVKESLWKRACVTHKHALASRLLQARRNATERKSLSRYWDSFDALALGLPYVALLGGAIVCALEGFSSPWLITLVSLPVMYWAAHAGERAGLSAAVPHTVFFCAIGLSGMGIAVAAPMFLSPAAAQGMLLHTETPLFSGAYAVFLCVLLMCLGLALWYSIAALRQAHKTTATQDWLCVFALCLLLCIAVLYPLYAGTCALVLFAILGRLLRSPPYFYNPFPA